MTSAPGLHAEGQVLTWRRGPELIRVEAWGRDGARVRVVYGGPVVEGHGALLPPAATAATAEIAEEERVRADGSAKVRRTGLLENGRLRVELTDYGELRFTDRERDETVLAERPRDAMGYPARFCHDDDGGGRRLAVEFAAYEGERIYGLGQHPHGLLDQKGCTLELHHHNGTFSVPFALSSRGYGLLWNHPGSGRVGFGRNLTRWEADRAPQLDYWVAVGADLPAVLERYAEATGKPPVMPDWAAGFWQSKLRYASQDEVLAVAREHVERGIPLDVIVIDFFHWTAMGDWRFDPEAFPDPAAMVAELAAMGVKVAISVWPTITPESGNFQAMRDGDLLVRDRRGAAVQRLMNDNRPADSCSAPVYFYDATNPAARRFIWEACRRGYHEAGVAAYWLDCCEPELKHTEFQDLRLHAGRGDAVIARYPCDHAAAFAEGIRAAGDEPVLLCRSGWAGSQRHGAVVWSGDIPGTFAEMRRQIAAGLNVGLSGLPWWNADIGGFFLWDGMSRESPAYAEVLIRWFQWGVFTPVCRLHGNRSPNEIWTYGEEAYAILAELVRLRRALKPYTLAQMRRAAASGLPPMRPLFLDHPDDPACVDIDDQFLFGPDILVCPVTEADARLREVYLPAGRWTHAWTGEGYAGGERHEVAAPLAHSPVFYRHGADLPRPAGSGT